MPLDAFGQQTLPSALAPPGKRGATALGLHPRAETVLLFARAFGWLISAFHVSGSPISRAAKVGTRTRLSMHRALSSRAKSRDPATVTDGSVPRFGQKQIPESPKNGVKLSPLLPRDSSTSLGMTVGDCYGPRLADNRCRS